MKKLVMVVTMVCCIFLMCSCNPAITNPANSQTSEKYIENYDSHAFADRDNNVTLPVGGNDVTGVIR